MEYRGFEYTIVQGIGGRHWKWSVLLDAGLSVTGQTISGAEAVVEAERAIERVLTPKRRRLIRRRFPD